MPRSADSAAAQAKLELLREHASDQLKAACLQGQLAPTHLQIADDTALTYALRRLVHHVTEAAITAREIIAVGTLEGGDGRSE